MGFYIVFIKVIIITFIAKGEILFLNLIPLLGLTYIYNINPEIGKPMLINMINIFSLF